MNSATCVVDQYRIQYREVGTSSWSSKTMGGPVGTCTYGNQRIDKLLLGLTGATDYEYEMKAWYCGGGASSWTATHTFTTADNCPNVGNLQVYGATSTKATFTWDASNGVYSFVRLKARVDSISNPTDPDWFQIGGMGVSYGTNTKDKNGLIPGETYRGQARAFCDPNGGAYFSLSWTPLVYWTQPVVRVEGGEAIANLEVYPNPSRDVFNIAFTSETVQDLRVRILDVVGEEIILEDLHQFVGEYTKQVNLEDHAKGIYFLEIETDDGVINKKLILQ
jgi:predicted small integral membrane protein